MDFYYKLKGYYTIPSDNRELQPPAMAPITFKNYTIPSDNRELQQIGDFTYRSDDYTIPSDNRELQLVRVCLLYQ